MKFEPTGDPDNELAFERVTGPEMTCVFCGLDGSIGEAIDVTSSFVASDTTRFTIKLNDEEFEKLKDIRPGTVVKVNLL